jgi:hypothetical protein
LSRKVESALGMERHTSLRQGERGNSVESLRSLERGDRETSSIRTASVRAAEKLGMLRIAHAC